MSEADTSGRDPEDAKAWFYLDHRDDIEAWKALRPDARQLLDKHLVGLEAQVEELAEEFQVQAVAGDLEAGSWPRTGLRNPAWQHDGVGNLGVVIEWERARLLTPGSNEWPYVAVRLLREGNDPDHRQLWHDAMKPIRSQLNARSSRNFPVWRYVATESPVDPQALMRLCMSGLRELWETSTASIDAIYARALSN